MSMPADHGPIADQAWTLDDLMAELRKAASTRGSKDLTLAEDVWTAMRDSVPESGPVMPWETERMAAQLLAVNVILGESFEPGRFRLVHHDNCDVDTETRTVDHSRCTVTAEGIVRL